MKNEKTTTEEFSVSGKELVDKVKEIIKQGNVRKIMIKNEKGETLVEIPVTIAVIGAVLVPVLAAVAAIAALVSKCTIVVEKRT